MRVQVLGPLTVVGHAAVHEIDAGRHRAVLAAIASRSGAAVQVSELVDAVWADNPPRSANKTLHGYVSSLRKQFGEGLIETVPGGYRIGPDVEAVDADQFEALVASGRRLLASGDLKGARGDLTSALALWRGQPVVDLAPGPVKDGYSARLDELRVLARTARAEAELGLGHHFDVIPELEQLVAEHPYREPLWRALMVAHHRAGNPGAALRAARRLREVLRDDLGIDPSTESQDLERRILAQDRSLDFVERPPGNLPNPVASFVGRRLEQQQLVEFLASQRLVTLVGVGGAGKSRLANRVVQDITAAHAGGTWWIDMAAMPHSGTVLGRVLAAMDLPVQTTSTPEEVLLARLRRSPTLLVLDNCEHQQQPVATFVEWVTSREPWVQVLATSRVPLAVSGEQLLHVGPLPTDGEGSDGQRLFVERVAARGDVGAVEPSDVAAIVDAVGGLPLGIELAAAQCAVRTVSEVAQRLRERRGLLRLAGDGDGDDRHHSLRHALDTTVDALDPELAAALPRLAVFPGDFGLDAAAATLEVAPDDAASMVAAFTDASLVTATSAAGRTRRFRLLWPVRELLLDRCGPAVADESLGRCAEHFRRFAAAFLDDADGPAESRWLTLAQVEEHNLRLALGWWEARDPIVALEFGPGLGRAWQVRGDQAEGRDTLRRLLTRAPEASSFLVAATEVELSFLELLSGDAAAALAIGTDAIDRLESIQELRWLSRALRSQAHAFHLGGMSAATTDPIYQRSLDAARRAHLPYSRALTEVHFAQACGAFEEFERAERMLSHAEVLLHRHDDHGLLAHAALGRALIAYGRGDTEACRRAGEELMRQAQLAADTIWVQVASVVLALTWAELGDESRSTRYFRDAVHLAYDTANTAQLGIAFHALAAASSSAHAVSAARLYGAAGSLTPIWPLHARRYGELMASARAALGDRFDAEVAMGRRLSVDEAVALADRLTGTAD